MNSWLHGGYEEGWESFINPTLTKSESVHPNEKMSITLALHPYSVTRDDEVIFSSGEWGISVVIYRYRMNGKANGKFNIYISAFLASTCPDANASKQPEIKILSLDLLHFLFSLCLVWAHNCLCNVQHLHQTHISMCWYDSSV